MDSYWSTLATRIVPSVWTSMTSATGGLYKSFDCFSIESTLQLYFANIRFSGDPEYLAKIGFLSMSVGDLVNKKRDKSCDLSRLVEQTIEISNKFIEDYKAVYSFSLGYRPTISSK